MGHRRDRADGRAGGRAYKVRPPFFIFYIFLLTYFTIPTAPLPPEHEKHLPYHVFFVFYGFVPHPSTRTRRMQPDGRVFVSGALPSTLYHPDPRHANATPVSRSSCLGCPSTCKGYCGRAGRGAERGTSRGSKEERIRIRLQVWANIRNNGYKR